MAGRDRSKDASLAASRTLNPHPETVTDPVPLENRVLQLTCRYSGR